ncbi:SDR family NAD(P)-dependent oxidoreductase [Microbacterium sp. No. 7]|uniref:SDR family NAD(P)-dependent oxidoreductase n=1 Tax=Microbacterium sp. No. 7 TaxID=1714373 RepID=UPI0006D1440F|nr:SDR family NAD(P)-dependent oxidoreductase [Microbacterium sp. No. 7]ALJ20850.1 hypothetical protein AOA12_13425 [Microbacterium sp. No. 7]
MTERFRGRIVLVNAAAGVGIGSSVVRRFMQEGAAVAVSDRNPKRLRALEDELVSAHGAERVLAIAGDAGDEQAVTALVDAVAERYGRLDVLVNSVGLNILAEWPHTPLDTWRTVLDTSLTSHYLHARAAWPLLQRSDAAAIVNISSLAAQNPAPFGEVAYAAAKGGVLGLTAALAAEGARDRIRVNAVMPGLIWNERLTAGVADEYVDAYRSKRLFDADGTPDEVADLIAFLASTDARNITGQAIKVGAQ